MLRLTILNLFFTVANASLVLLTTNSKEGNNMFCPGEPIIVKCSGRNSAVRWHIGETSFYIFGNADVTFAAGPHNEGKYAYMDTTIGRLNFYQNKTYVGSTFENLTLNSELHMHLNDENEFIEVTCKELWHRKKKTINITVFPGMLIMAYDKLMCYCKFILLHFYKHFSHSEILPLITIKLTTIHYFEDAMMSYHVLNWTIEDQANVAQFILRVHNFSIVQTHNSKNVSIYRDMKSYFFKKYKRDSLLLSIVSLDKCNRIHGMSNNVNLPPTFTCK